MLYSRSSHALHSGNKLQDLKPDISDCIRKRVSGINWTANRRYVVTASGDLLYVFPKNIWTSAVTTAAATLPYDSDHDVREFLSNDDRILVVSIEVVGVIEKLDYCVPEMQPSQEIDDNCAAYR